MAHTTLDDTGFDLTASDGATLEAVANERRRVTLDVLAGTDAPVALADLTRQVAVREARAPVTDVPAQRIQSIRRTLYHAHLPKLDDVGLVAFDPDERVVEATTTGADWGPDR